MNQKYPAPQLRRPSPTSRSTSVSLLSGQPLSDEGFHQAQRTVQVRTGRIDKIVRCARQQLELDLATCSFIRSSESLLNLRRHVLVFHDAIRVRAALKQQDWWQPNRLAAVQDELRIAIVKAAGRSKIDVG